MILHEIDQHSEAWHQIRCGRITGTRFASLMMGESTKGYKDLVTNIACEIITGKAEESYSNAIMEYGLETEPLARAEYEHIFECEVKQVGFISPDEDNKYSEWIGISPDGILPIDQPYYGLLEIKCPLMKTHLGYIEDNRLPNEYKYQVQGQLFTTGFQHCDFMSFVPNMKPFLIRVYPDEKLFKEFEKRLDILIIQVQSKLINYHKYDYLS